MWPSVVTYRPNDDVLRSENSLARVGAAQAAKGRRVGKALRGLRRSYVGCAALLSRPSAGLTPSPWGRGWLRHELGSYAKTLTPTLSPGEREPAVPVIFC